MSDAYAQINNLLHRYSEAVDSAQFDDIDDLFEHACIRVAMGSAEPGAERRGPGISTMYRDSIILYGDGTPRTRHIVSNAIIEIEEEAGRATSRSYNTTLQQVPGREIEIIATARYEDTFERIDGTWRFTERIIRHASVDGVNRDFIGDMSFHARGATAAPAQIERS